MWWSHERSSIVRKKLQALEKDTVRLNPSTHRKLMQNFICLRALKSGFSGLLAQG